MTTVGIIQPNYLPWRGYFDFMSEVDLFVFLDDVQYTRRDWRNRNRIKLPDGRCTWMSVPVHGGRDLLIKDVSIDQEQNWARKHLEALRHSYGGTPHFDRYFPQIEEVLLGRCRFLVELDVALCEMIAGWLGLTTRFGLASSYSTQGAKDDKLLAIVQAAGGTAYLSGPSARDYMRPALWKGAGIDLRYKDYSGYPEYAQISEPFEPQISVLDLLFMKGPDSPEYIWGELRER